MDTPRTRAKIRILAVCPNPDDATAWYRVISPLAQLRKETGGVIEYEIKNKANHLDILGSDVVLLQRPIAQDHLAFARLVRLYGRALWIDYDDDYLDVPTSNPRMLFYASADSQRAIREICAIADIITVSSKTLAEKMRPFQPKGRVAYIPNGWDYSIQAPPPDHDLPVMRVLWRGGDSHLEDLQHFGDAIVSASTKTHALFEFFGLMPWWLLDRFPPQGVICHPFTNLHDYWLKLPQLRAKILIVPLVESTFNKCKSNISVLEAAYGGAVPLVPAWAGWSAEGVEVYTDKKDFESKIIALTKTSFGELKRRNEALRAWVKKNQDVASPMLNGVRARLCLALAEIAAERSGFVQEKGRQHVE